MAIKIYEKFAPRANPADFDYPYGSIKNESVPGAKDGTPLDAEWGNDYAGFDAELFAQAGIVPSGQPDKLGASQRADALHRIFDTYGTVASLAAGKHPVGAYVTVKDRGLGVFLVQSGGTPNGKGTLNAGNGNSAAIQESLLFGSDVDVSILGYNYDDSDVTPYLDEFLTLFNGTGTTAVISDSNTLFGSPCWLNEIPKDVHIKSVEGVTVTSNTPQAGNEAAFNALINLRGTRGVEQTTVSANVSEGDDFIDVIDASGVTEGNYIEIDLREQDIVSPYSTLVKQAAALVLVTGVVGNRIYIDYVFPFDMIFQASAKKVVYKNITPALNCSVNLNYVDVTVNNGEACFGVHMYHAANCKSDITASGIIANAIMHTYTYNCESDGFFKDARAITGGYGYGCQVSASTRHHFGSLIGNNVRHTLDYSNAGWCTGDYCHDSQSVAGLTTHGFSEHNIVIDTLLANVVFLAESGAEFGYHNKNITINNLVCDTLTCGYVENLIVNSGKILTEFEVRRGGSYTLTSDITLMDYQGRNGRVGTLLKQGVDLVKGSLVKYVAANFDYLTTSFTKLKNNVSSPSTANNVLSVKHSHPTRETHREVFSGVGFSYQWNDGDFSNNDISAVPLIATSRLTGGTTVIKVNGVKLGGGSLVKLLQLLQFNDTGTNKLIADVSGNFMSDMVVDSSSINGAIYDIRGIVYGDNVRVNSPALVAAYVTNNDVTVAL